MFKIIASASDSRQSRCERGAAALALLVVCIGLSEAALAVGSQTTNENAASIGATSSEETGATVGLTLEDAVELASSGASRVDRAARSATISDLQVRNARAAYFPRLDVAVSANQSAIGSEFRSSDVSRRRRMIGDFRSGVSVSGSVPIDLSGTIARQVRSAKINKAIALLEVERASNETIADVQIAYFGALQAQSAVELDEQVVSAIKRLMSASAHLPPSVVSFLGIEVANAEQTLNQRIAARDQALDGLKRLIGLEPETEVILASRLPTVVELKAVVNPSAMSVAGSERRDLAIARHRVSQAELAIKRADDQRGPTMRAGVYVDQYVGGKFVSDGGRTSTRNVGFNISINLPVLNLDAGQAGNTRKVALLQADQAKADFVEMRRQIGYDMKQSRAAWLRALERLTRLPNAADAARAFELAQRNLLSASANEAQAHLAQLSNARQTWRNAEGATRDAVVELAGAAIRLRRAEGGAIGPRSLERDNYAAGSGY